jgi:alkanesulfonate monooxygenase SsuD/methylene tetrahydromethanopterin reductase-like flavin-dependent oxidoreductase (luciferase family)
MSNPNARVEEAAGRPAEAIFLEQGEPLFRALETAVPYLAEKYRSYADWGQDRALPGQESFRVPFEELQQSRFILGSPDDCIEQLLPYVDEMAGVIFDHSH